MEHKKSPEPIKNEPQHAQANTSQIDVTEQQKAEISARQAYIDDLNEQSRRIIDRNR